MQSSELPHNKDDCYKPLSIETGRFVLHFYFTAIVGVSATLVQEGFESSAGRQAILHLFFKVHNNDIEV